MIVWLILMPFCLGLDGCSAGYYLSKETGKCEYCPEGTYQDTSNYSESYCRECPSGFGVRDKRTSCKICESGSFSNSKRVCEKCSENQYQPLQGQTFCLVCEEGKHPNIGNSQCVNCGIGLYGLNGFCYKCPPGTYSDTEGMGLCKGCVNNSIQPKESQSSCITCGDNTFSNPTNTKCIECSFGYQVNNTEDVCFNRLLSKKFIKKGCAIRKSFIVLYTIMGCIGFVLIIGIFILVGYLFVVRQEKIMRCEQSKENLGIELETKSDVIKMYLG